MSRANFSAASEVNTFVMASMLHFGLINLSEPFTHKGTKEIITSFSVAFSHCSHQILILLIFST